MIEKHELDMISLGIGFFGGVGWAGFLVFISHAWDAWKKSKRTARLMARARRGGTR